MQKDQQQCYRLVGGTGRGLEVVAFSQRVFSPRIVMLW